jgi:hypothetical protein
VHNFGEISDGGSISILDQKHACVQNAIVGKHCKIGQWARVDGAPEDPTDNKNQLNITILGTLFWLTK